MEAGAPPPAEKVSALKFSVRSCLFAEQEVWRDRAPLDEALGGELPVRSASTTR